MIVVYILLAILVSSIIFHFVMIYALFLRFYGRISAKKMEKNLHKDPYYHDYLPLIKECRDKLEGRYEDVYTEAFDRLKLHGFYFDNNSKRIVIMFHGAHSSAFNNFGYIANNMLDHGYSLLIIDERAHGLSEGKYFTYGVKEHKDVLTWVDFVKNNYPDKEIILYGISMGAHSIALASDQLDERIVKAMVLDSSFENIDELFDNIMKTHHVPTFLFGRAVGFLSIHKAGMEYRTWHVRDHISKTKVPCLFVHGDADNVAPIPFFMDNYNACSSRKEKMVIKGASHTLPMTVGKEEAFNKLYQFLEGNYE